MKNFSHNSRMPVSCARRHSLILCVRAGETDYVMDRNWPEVCWVGEEREKLFIQNLIGGDGEVLCVNIESSMFFFLPLAANKRQPPNPRE